MSNIGKPVRVVRITRRRIPAPDIFIRKPPKPAIPAPDIFKIPAERRQK